MANKVVALLEKGHLSLRRVLLIGGVTRNAALLEALRGKLAGTELVVLPESPWFEAWGTALLTRDRPLHKSPQLSHPPVFEKLPPLHRYKDRVQVLAAPSWQAPPDGPLVLGVDAGSTTTKTVLLDPATRAIVASHYTRTRGDPVAAVRECLNALIRQVGNRPVDLVGATGSALPRAHGQQPSTPLECLWLGGPFGRSARPDARPPGQHPRIPGPADPPAAALAGKGPALVRGPSALASGASG